MGNKNYHNYSKPYRQPQTVEPVVEETELVDSVEVQVEETTEMEVAEVVEETVEAAPELPTTVTGVVSGCKKLNVRNKPNATAAILTTVNDGSEVVIEQPITNSEFYRVTLANGMSGYCMKKFIVIK